MRYFTIMTGLRGCYMPDSAYCVAVKTRRDLKACLEGEARNIREAGFVGCSKRSVAWLAAEAWRRKRWDLDLVVPYRNADQPGNWAFGLFLSCSTRADWLEYQKENDL